MKYDFLIVGAGLYGAVFAYEMKQAGFSCLVIDKRKHIGGNLYCEKIEGINVHMYGPHIFHTNNQSIWEYVNQFVDFNNFIYQPLASFKGNYYNLPFNMNTFYQLWGVKTPDEARQIISEQSKYQGEYSDSLEGHAIRSVGKDLYEKLIKGYTEKQWGTEAHLLPASIIKRVPIRFIYNNNYFNDHYQGIPKGGYNVLIKALLNDIDVMLEVDFFKDRSRLDNLSNYMLFTGQIDRYYNYRFGMLQYRSLSFHHQLKEISNYQGVAVINHTEREVPFTRLIEHKHFEFGNQSHTVITKEYPSRWSEDKEAYYPVNDSKNEKLFNQYAELAKLEKRVFFGGRLGDYRYYDMHQVIAASLKMVKKLKPILQNIEQ